MLPHTDSLAAALAVVAGPVFVQLDAVVFKLCHAVRTKPIPQSLPGPVFCTWRPKGTHVFTLIKNAADTVIYCHDNDTAYFAAPCAKLAPGFPAGVAVLGHWCMDENKKDGTKEPHLLIFDILDQGAQSPACRGERLRLLSAAMPQPLCVLQWAGDLEALQQFVPTLPHEVECTVALTEDPLVVYTREASQGNAGQALSSILVELSKADDQ